MNTEIPDKDAEALREAVITILARRDERPLAILLLVSRPGVHPYPVLVGSDLSTSPTFLVVPTEHRRAYYRKLHNAIASGAATLSQHLADLLQVPALVAPSPSANVADA